MDLLNRIAGIVAAAVLISSASVASAFGINMSVRGGLQAFYTPSDSVIIDVFLDADAPGITLITVSVQAHSPALTYDGPASALLPVVHTAPEFGTTGAQPGYILYSPPVRPSSRRRPAAIMYPAQTPAWSLIPAASFPPGKTVVNISYTEAFTGATGTTFATGSNIWIGSLVYDISGSGAVSLSLDPALGGTFSSFDGGLTEIPGVTLGPDIEIVVPEPTTALFIGIGLLALAGRRKL